MNKAILKEQVEFLQKLIDAIPNPIFYKNRKGIYLGCNHAFETYLGKGKSQVVGKSVFELSPQALSSTYNKMDEELFQNCGAQNYESSVMYADGTLRDVIFDKAVYTNVKNEIAGLVGVITVITERKKTELELKKSTEKLNSILEQIVQAMARITETRDMYLRDINKESLSLQLQLHVRWECLRTSSNQFKWQACCMILEKLLSLEIYLPNLTH